MPDTGGQYFGKDAKWKSVCHTRTPRGTPVFTGGPLTTLFTFAISLVFLSVLGGVFRKLPSPKMYRGFGTMDFSVPAHVALFDASIGLIALPVRLVPHKKGACCAAFAPPSFQSGVFSGRRSLGPRSRSPSRRQIGELPSQHPPIAQRCVHRSGPRGGSLPRGRPPLPALVALIEALLEQPRGFGS